MKCLVFIIAFVCCISTIIAQTDKERKNEQNDSLFIYEVEDRKGPDKVLHAEPLYIDLIRDLGARKGESEWNLGFGLTDNDRFDKYTALIEYEWAPIDRLGLEVELPFTFYIPNGSIDPNIGSKLNSIKLAGQYSFYVSEEHSTSMALGYIHEIEMNQFTNYRRSQLFTGNIFNPFFVAAKRFGNNYHTLLYTGPSIGQHFVNKSLHTVWQINSNLHYMITGTRNFLGVEFNKEVTSEKFEMVIRPQMRVGVSENLMIGIVTEIPISKDNQRLGSFLRLIYEPGGHK
jgi:hypothetical protein